MKHDNASSKRMPIESQMGFILKRPSSPSFNGSLSLWLNCHRKLASRFPANNCGNKPRISAALMCRGSGELELAELADPAGPAELADKDGCDMMPSCIRKYDLEYRQLRKLSANGND